MLADERNGRPYVRWWWLSGPFRESDIQSQLQWIFENGFGGVELAWIDPSWLEEPERSAPRPAFLSDEWSRLVLFAKVEAAALGLGCDFTFGSAWPFGGSWVTPENAAKTFDGLSTQRLGGSWESSLPITLSIVDHLSSVALEHYSAPLLKALAPALSGGKTALFCDSLEIATEQLWSPLLWDEFASRFGYRLEPFAPNLDLQPEVRYDYRKLRADAMVREFYQPFTALCHQHEAYSRVQCHGAPTDLLAAYAAVDIPESEAILFLPRFSRIAASAAAWTGTEIVSAEAFTCLHGFPGWDEGAEDLWQEEQAGDLKLLADALFANGVNQLVWHGMPYRPQGGEQEFYAAVHVGPDSPFASSLPGLNDYFTQVCRFLREGQTYASVGVYLPNEDAFMLDRIPEGQRTPGANFHWEMRQTRLPEEVQTFAPVWISLPFLKAACCKMGTVLSRHLRLAALYVDCKWLDRESLVELRRLREEGARIIWRTKPREPGRTKTADYERLLDLAISEGSDLSIIQPLLLGRDIPIYWAREIQGDLLLFFAHPKTKEIRYPLLHRLAETAVAETIDLEVNWGQHRIPIGLEFGRNDGLLMKVNANGSVTSIPLPRARNFGA